MLLVDKNKAVIVGLLLSSSAISVTNAQMSHMAPNDPCIATQIQMYGNIAP